jgi:hypothetical protein
VCVCVRARAALCEALLAHNLVSLQSRQVVECVRVTLCHRLLEQTLRPLGVFRNA